MKKERERKGHMLYNSKGTKSVYLGWPTEAANWDSIAKTLCKQPQNPNHPDKKIGVQATIKPQKKVHNLSTRYHTSILPVWYSLDWSGMVCNPCTKTALKIFFYLSQYRLVQVCIDPNISFIPLCVNTSFVLIPTLYGMPHNGWFITIQQFMPRIVQKENIRKKVQ